MVLRLRRQKKMLPQLLPEFLAEVGHICEAVRMFLPEPFPDLLRPEFFFTDRFKIVLKTGKIQLPDILGNNARFGHAAKIT